MIAFLRRPVGDLSWKNRYIHACELGGDGNHGLQKKRKHDDPDDFSLSAGKGYFVDAAKMQSYLEGIDLETPVSRYVMKHGLC